MGLCASKADNTKVTKVEEIKDDEEVTEEPNKKSHDVTSKTTGTDRSQADSNTFRRMSLNLSPSEFEEAETRQRKLTATRDATEILEDEAEEDPVAKRKRLVAESKNRKKENDGKGKKGEEHKTSAIILNNPLERNRMIVDSAKDDKLHNRREKRRVSRIVDPNAPRASQIFAKLSGGPKKPIFGISLAKTPFRIRRVRARISTQMHAVLPSIASSNNLLPEGKDTDLVSSNNSSSKTGPNYSAFGVLLPGSDPTGQHAQECEDNLYIDENFRGKSEILSLIFDGHGHQGALAAMYCEKRFVELLTNDFAADLDRGDPKEAFRKVFNTVDEGLQESWRMILSGTTVTAIYLKDSKLYSFNCGNSSAYLFRSIGEDEMECISLTKEHTLEDEAERKRVITAGGRVKRGSAGVHRVYEADGFTPGLSLSRTLGDIKAHELGVSSLPYESTHDITPQDQFIVSATDGLWQVYNYIDVSEFLNKNRDKNIDNLTRMLINDVQERWSKKSKELSLVIDDTAIAIVRLNKNKANG
eukprot:g75.t1